MRASSKLCHSMLLGSAILSANAMAANFVATDTATLQANATFAAEVPVALTGPATLAPGAYTVAMPLDAAGNPISLGVIGGPVGSTVPTATAGLLTPQLQGAGAPIAYQGLTATGQRIDITTRGNLVAATVASPVAGLTYSNFGSWQQGPAALATAGQLTVQMFAGGTLPTTALQMPLMGSAAYTGIAAISGTDGAQMYEGDAQVGLAANFGTHSITGTISPATIVNTATQLPAGTLNSLAVNGTFVGNSFTGSVTALAAPGPVAANPLALTAGTAGTTSGKFYGPTANEVTGVFSVNTPTTKIAGSFGAKR